ncbi:hypothetical protein Slin14017_G057050 [Septoria linicola]|nr:hypothetical protein Slin14017_G057050 [Septoria linicola]
MEGVIPADGVLSASLHSDEGSGERCSQLLGSDKFRALVKAITFHTSENLEAAPWNEYNDLDFEEHRAELDPPTLLCKVLSKIGRFVNLETLDLKFAADCADPSNDLWEGPQTTTFRKIVMRSLLEAFEADDQLPKFHRLRIRNLQDYLSAAEPDHPGFGNMLGKLDSLSLRIASETSDAAPELELDCTALHSFFNTQLKDTFLRPIASQLKEVKLYTIHSQWGVYPACNLEDIHFPQLEKLALGNYVFAYDWQVDWIVSHGSTMKTLVLDNCPITYCGNVGWELHDLEPGANFTVDDTDERPIASHREHVYGAGATSFDERFDDVPGDMLNTARYQVQGMGESSILDGAIGEREYTDAELRSADGFTFADPPPKCYEEDMTALCELLEVIRDRR